jgi:hypothetical protein
MLVSAPPEAAAPGKNRPEQPYGIQQPIQPELACGQEQHAAKASDQDRQDCRDPGDPAEERSSTVVSRFGAFTLRRGRRLHP